MSTISETSHWLALGDEQATRRLASELAVMLQGGDLLTLSGELGAGKTMFARALIRRLAEDDHLEVPSPTFTLVQSYALQRCPVIHVDLYRVGDESELLELGFLPITEPTVILLEWPERAGSQLPADRLDIALSLSPGHGLDYRTARLTGFGSFAPRLRRWLTIRNFLNETGFGKAERRYLQGDASTRAYEWLCCNRQSFVLMNAPPRPDGPAVRNGRPYSAIAHLAENVTPFVAIARALRAHAFSAPEIYASDLTQGLLILEDLGREGIVETKTAAPLHERYVAAVDLLLALQEIPVPSLLPVAPQIAYQLPTYDLDALLIELELMLDWYLPYRGVALPTAQRQAFVVTWRPFLDQAVDAPKTWVLRDYHSPNLLWLAHRNSIARIGLLDFQDAVSGPAAYDLASLLQDGRVDVSAELEEMLLRRYVRGRHAAQPAFDARQFRALYAVVAAQRATKLLGIFVRLDVRDGKPQYLRHLPRIWGYLHRALAHPSLAPLKLWYDTHVPGPPA